LKLEAKAFHLTLKYTCRKEENNEIYKSRYSTKRDVYLLAPGLLVGFTGFLTGAFGTWSEHKNSLVIKLHK